MHLSTDMKRLISLAQDHRGGGRLGAIFKPEFRSCFTQRDQFIRIENKTSYFSLLHPLFYCWHRIQIPSASVFVVNAQLLPGAPPPPVSYESGGGGGISRLYGITHLSCGVEGGGAGDV
jgi:hypothetical protein